MSRREKSQAEGIDEDPVGGIIETKFLPSRSTSTLLVRDRLESLLQEALNTTRMIMLSAPAGAGKSSLVSAWSSQLEKQGIPTAWINLDIDDRDPVHFLSCIVAGICRVFPSGQHRARALLGANFQPSARQILLALIADLSYIKEKVVVFLEDYHLICSEEINDVISQLIRLAPENLMLVITSREQPELYLADLKMNGQVKEVTGYDLAFNLNEVQAFAAGQFELSVAKQTIETLWQKTEGWIAGIQLFFLAVKGGADPTDLLNGFSGTDRDVSDYLSDTVLHQQPDEVKDFLLQTAPLERMSAELCEVVTGNSRSRAMLEELERRNLFVISLDRSRHWYRYHHLFAEFLISRRGISDPGGMEITFNAAMRWSRENGYTSEAITYALKANDYKNASQMIKDISIELVQYHGAHTTLLNWIKRLPPEYLSLRPLLRIYYAWSLTFTHQHDEAHKQLELLETECDLSASPNVEMTDKDRCYVEESAGMIRAVIMGLKGQYEECQNLSTQLLNRSPETLSFNIGTVANALGYSCIGTFEFTAGKAAIHRGVAAFQECGAEYGVAWARAIEGMLVYGEGNITQAKKVHEDALTIAESSWSEDSHTSGIHKVLLARVLYETNDLGESHKYLKDGFYCISEIGSPEFTIAGYSVLARMTYLDGGLSSALSIVDEAIQLLKKYGLVHMIPIIAAEKVSLLLRDNQLQNAMTAAEEYALLDEVLSRGGADNIQAIEADQLSRVRIYLASSEPNKANGVVSILIRSARNSKRHGLLITALILKSIALKSLGKERESFRCLNEALLLAAPLNQIRRFTDEGSALNELLSDFLSRASELSESRENQVSTHYLQALATACELNLNAISQDDTDKNGGSVAYPLESMTNREIELLRLVEKGYSNRELADELFISEKTVKWHLHNAFTKLGVKNRSGAVARARSLNLI